jgi:Transposase DDE domain
MQEEIITIYVICDDYLKDIGHRDHSQAEITMAEVMTIALVSARFFKNCLEHSRVFMHETGYTPNEISESRLNRRLHGISEGTWLGLFYRLAEIHKLANIGNDYAVDSMPVPVCDNYRIKRCRLYQNKAFRGYIASKRRYFYGLRLHVVVTSYGMPVDLVLAPGADADISVFKRLNLDLPDGSTIYADKAYTDYVCEDMLNQDTQITLTAMRKSNSTRPIPGWLHYICHHVRKQIETTFSQIADYFAKRIYAITAKGAELKAFLAVLAFSICG